MGQMAEKSYKELLEENNALKRKLKEISSSFSSELLEDRKKIERKLAKSERKFRNVFDNIPLIALMFDLNGNIIYANNHFIELSGWKHKEVIGLNWVENFIDKKDYDFIKQLFGKIILDRKPQTYYINDIVLKDKTKRTISWSNIILFDVEDKIEFISSIGFDISESLESREKLRFQSMLLDQIRDVVVATDLNGNITYANKAEENAMKLSQDKLIGMSVEQFGDSPLEGATQKEVIKNTLENGEWQGEVVNFDKNGEKIYFNVRTTILYDENANHIGMLGISTDITERKKVDIQLQKTKNILQKAQSLAHVGSWEMNLRTGETFWSDEFFRICGYKPQSFVPSSEKGMQIIHPEDRKIADIALSKAISERENYSIEKRIVRPDGEIRYVLSQGEIVVDRNGDPEYIIGSFLDITERKKIEMALEKKIFALTQPDMPLESIKLTDIVGIEVLQEIQNHFSESFDLPAVIYDTNNDFITSPSNFSDFCKLIMNSPKGLKNCKVFYQKLKTELQKNPPPIIIKQGCSVNNLLSGTVPIIIEGRHLANFTCGQIIEGDLDIDEVKKYAQEIGTDTDVLLNAAKKLNKIDMKEFQKIVDFLSVLAKQISNFGYQNLQQARFIAEQKRFDKELLESKIKAEESNRLKTAFLANMSHEIRTPMNGIIGFSQLLLDDEINLDEIAEYATIININANQLLSLLNDIIDLSKIETGEMNVNLQIVAIESLMNVVYTSFYNQSNEKGLELILDYNDDIKSFSILCDEGKVIQVLNNLISNAIKFTDSGNIHLGCDTYDNSVRFYVRDTGIGLAQDQIEKIFSRFYQVENYITKTKRGTGLGLSISKALAELMGGKLWCESEQGKGATFYFELEYSGAKSNDVIQENLMSDYKELSKKEFTVLVVEDDESNMLLFKRIISGTKAKIITAINGKEALEQFILNPDIDIVLMDIKMPVMNGYEATRKIKELSPKTPVIAQTAYAFSNDAAEAIEAGCDDYISKPIDIDKLLRMISKHLK